MKNTKKLLALLLSVVMLLGVFVVTTSAEDAVVEETAVGVSNVTIKTDADIVKAGDVITVTVNVSTDYNAAAMRWPILFSNSFFEYEEGSETFAESLVGLGGRTSIATNSTDSKNFTPGYTPENYRCVLIQWIGTASAEQSGVVFYNNTEGADIFTFRLKVKDDVTKGMSGEIVIGNEEQFYDITVNADVEKPTLSNGGLYYSDVTFNCTGAEVEFPVPRLEAVEGTSTVIDKENGLVRGIDLNVVDNIDDYAKAVGCEVQITPSKDNRMGTGTTVTLIDEGEEYSTYTIIIAGDVNGDGLVDAIDYIMLDLMESSAVVLTDAGKLAADLNGDDEVTSADKVALDANLIFEGEIDQATGRYVANN